MTTRNSMVEENRSGLELLFRAGLSKVGARTLILIAMNGHLQSVDIESALNVGQSGVSSAIRELTVRGWIRTEVISTQSKGRPRHVYMLSKPFSDIVDEIENVCEGEISEIHRGVNELRRIASLYG